MSKSITNESQIKDALNSNAEIMVCTSGVSMYPMLRNRKDIVVLIKPTKKLKKNDVPLYQANGKLVLHRILRIKPEHIVIRGDNLIQKEYVDPKQIIAVLKGFYRNEKYYDCEKNIKYKIYVILMKITYPTRWCWKSLFRPILSKIKAIFINKR